MATTIPQTLLDRFKGIGAAKLTERGQYLLAGNHKLKLQRIVIGETTMAPIRPFMVAEFKCIETTSPNMRVNETYTYFVYLDTTYAMNNVLSLFVAIYSALNGSPVDPSTVTFDACVSLVSPVFEGENKDGTPDTSSKLLKAPGELAAGVVLLDRAIQKQQKADKTKETTYHNWKVDFEATKAALNPA